METVLTVTAPLKATIEPKVQTVDFGRPAVFTCKFEGSDLICYDSEFVLSYILQEIQLKLYHG